MELREVPWQLKTSKIEMWLDKKQHILKFSWIFFWKFPKETTKNSFPKNTPIAPGPSRIRHSGNDSQQKSRKTTTMDIKIKIRFTTCHAEK